MTAQAKEQTHPPFMGLPLNESQVGSGNLTHPCFYAAAGKRYGRVHLPVASGCNIQCRYCRRDYACANENRPGVCAGLLSPESAVARLERTLADMPRISVAGIAGPGDAFSDPDKTLETFELIRRKYPDLSLCVSTNGFNIRDSVPELKKLDVGFVTLTINTLDAGLGSRIYKWVGRSRQAGAAGAGELIARQTEALLALKSAGFIVKVNTVVIPGINDTHIPFLAKEMGRMGVDLMNLLPLIPVAGTDLADIRPPARGALEKLRTRAGGFLPQMRHCMRCRSDPAGMLKPCD